jgi:hypothetical protein
MFIAPDLRVQGNEVWVTLILFFCLLLFVWVRIINPQKIPLLVLGFFKGGTTEEKTITPDSIALFFVFICSSALLIMQAFRVHGIKSDFNSGGEFLFLGILLLAYYLIKIVVLLLCGVIFQVQNNARDYINEIFASAHLAALGLFPAALVLTYINSVNIAAVEKYILAILGLFLIYRTIKMFILMMNRGLHVIYLFLYLCTLEIIPLVLLFEYRIGIKF